MAIQALPQTHTLVVAPRLLLLHKADALTTGTQQRRKIQGGVSTGSTCGPLVMAGLTAALSLKHQLHHWGLRRVQGRGSPLGALGLSTPSVTAMAQLSTPARAPASPRSAAASTQISALPP